MSFEAERAHKTVRIVTSGSALVTEPIICAQMSYCHQTQELLMEGRPPLRLASVPAVCLFHLLLNADSEAPVIASEFQWIRSLASQGVKTDSAAAKVIITRLRAALYDTKSPYQYIHSGYGGGRRNKGHAGYFFENRPASDVVIPVEYPQPHIPFGV